MYGSLERQRKTSGRALGEPGEVRDELGWREEESGGELAAFPGHKQDQGVGWVSEEETMSGPVLHGVLQGYVCPGDKELCWGGGTWPLLPLFLTGVWAGPDRRKKRLHRAGVGWGCLRPVCMGGSDALRPSAGLTLPLCPMLPYGCIPCAFP